MKAGGEIGQKLSPIAKISGYNHKVNINSTLNLNLSE
jgi:hypothetical protein